MHFCYQRPILINLCSRSLFDLLKFYLTNTFTYLKFLEEDLNDYRNNNQI